MAQPAKRAKGPNGKGKTKGRGKGKAKDEEADLAAVVHTLGKLALRLDLQLRQQSLSFCLICFINNREESILQNLIATTAQWKTLAEQHHATKSLRSALWETMMSCLNQRVQLLAEAKEQDAMIAQAQKVGLLLTDRSWPFQEWNSHKQQMVQTSQMPKKMDAMLKCLQALEESSRDSQLVLSFHTMKPLPRDQIPSNHKDVQVYPWRLALDPLGMRYKPASMKPSALTQQLEMQLRTLR
eukprot:s240_g23.t1